MSASSVIETQNVDENTEESLTIEKNPPAKPADTNPADTNPADTNLADTIIADTSDLNSSSCEFHETSDALELITNHVDSACNPTEVESKKTFKLDPNHIKKGLDPPGKDAHTVESLDLTEGPPSAKETGYAWIVLLLVFTVNLVTAGNIKSFGITYTLILDYFPDASGTASGWILGLLIGCRCLLSPVMGALTVTIGPRKCVMLGTLICAASFVLAVPAYSIAYMAFTLGALFGIGMCMAETPGYILVTNYFDKRRSLANGVRAAGNPMGGVLFSPMVVLLHQHFGLKGAFLMMAGVTLQLVVVGMLMRPFNQHKKIVEEEYWRKRLQDSPSKRPREVQAKQDQVQTKKKKPLEFSYFKNPPYLVYLLVILCNSAAMPNALMYMPMYGRTIGLSDMQNSFIASYCSLSDFGWRLACGVIFNKSCIKKTHGFTAALLIGGVGCLAVPLCSAMWHLIIAATMFSLCMGFFWTLINVLLADQFGGDSMASTWGFFRMVQGICSFIYPSIVGYVMDVSGGMTAPYVMMGCLLILGAIIFALQPLIAKLPGSRIDFS